MQIHTGAGEARLPRDFRNGDCKSTPGGLLQPSVEPNRQKRGSSTHRNNKKGGARKLKSKGGSACTGRGGGGRQVAEKGCPFSTRINPTKGGCG